MVVENNFCISYGRYSVDNGLMECGGSDYRSVRVGFHVGSDNISEVGLGVQCVPATPRVKKMELEEKKSGSRKRSKPIQSGFVDDDEPIRSLFKLKSKRNPKKVNTVSDGDVQKGTDTEVWAEGDTLASFRKKLKGPKKDSGSGMTVGRSLGIDVAEPSGESLNGPVKDGGLVMETEVGEKAYVSGEDTSHAIMGKELGSSGKQKLRRFKSPSKPKKVQYHIGSHDASDDQVSGDCSISNQKKHALGSGNGSSHGLDDNLENPLSAFFQKKQSGSALRSKLRMGSQALKNRLDSDEVPENLLPVFSGRSQSASNFPENLPQDDADLQSASGRIPIDTAHNFNKMGNMDENPPWADELLELSSTPGIADLNMRSSDNVHGEYPKTIIVDSVSTAFIERSQSCLSPCSRKTTSIEKCEVGRQTSRIPEAPTLDRCGLDHLHGGYSEESLSVKVKGDCSLPSHEPISEIADIKGGMRAIDLAYDTFSMKNLTSLPVQKGKMDPFDACAEDVGFDNAVDQLSKSPSTNHISSLNQKMCSPSRKEGQEDACLDDHMLKRKREDLSQEILKQISGEIFECSPKAYLPYSSPFNEKMDVASNTEVKHRSIHRSQLQSSCSASGKPKKEESSSDCDGLNQVSGTCIEEPDIASVYLQKEDAAVYQSKLLPLASCGPNKHGFPAEMRHAEESLETGDDSDNINPELCHNESVTSVQMCHSIVRENQCLDDVPKETCIPDHDCLSGSGEANGVSSPSTTPDQNESYAEDNGDQTDPEFKDKKQSAVRRAARKPKKRRQGDMAYEGDVDWDSLIHEQGFLESRLVGEGDQSFRARGKFNSSSNMVTEAANGVATAVSAGLKARAVGPVEKIKFKEVLKRKGGLQEYLQCRNQILGLWSKDISRVLPLTECGVAASPPVDEPPRASLLREIYAFLDQSGYINVGVASEKDITQLSAMHNFKLSKEKSCGDKSGAPDSDTEDGVSFILGRVRSSEVCMGAKNGTLDDHNREAGATMDGKLVRRTMELSTITEPDEYRSEELHSNGLVDAKYPNRMVSSDVLSSNPSCKVLDNGAGLIPSLPTKHFYGVQSTLSDDMERNHSKCCGLEGRKKIIVIGAGPAGLTAARHLQRQGFFVTVLEARGRIGGRVYTDRSSLSVPVDLGASIITGVEADVATERRPDPSTLICAQLGLELTVLKSDCPLYDIVTGHKVPADLDEALEAEYNNLLDDMLLVVAQKGEQAMKMSLEEGLEYALKRRRLARLERNYLESDMSNSVGAVVDSDKTSVDGKVSENNSLKEGILSPLERRVMDWHFAHLEYGCAALLKEVSLPYWNQDDVYGGFGGAHCMIKGGYSSVVESLGEGLSIHLNHVVTNVSYRSKDCRENDDKCDKVKVSTLNGGEFSGDAVLITIPLGCLKAEAIKFFPPLPPWKNLSIQRLGFGVLNKVVLEFPNVFWDDSVDYFGATAEETNQRGQCFMFWNVKKTVGAPVLIALIVGKAAIDGQSITSSCHVNHAITVLRKLFGEAAVPDPVASVVTDWGKDPFSYGAYSYVAVGASGQDYDILGRPVENSVFFAGEATCKEHPDTVGGAMMSGLREAVRIIDILNTGNDITAEVESMEAAQRHSDSERNEVRDIVKRLEAVELSSVLYDNSLDGSEFLTREALLQDMFCNAKTAAGRLCLAKELLNIPIEILKSFAGTKEGLKTLNSWILDSMGKDGTQLLRHCVRLLVRVSTDLLAVRWSGIGKTVKEKVCVHTSRDIRAIASQLVNVWVEVFRKEKASNRGLKLLRQSTAVDSSRSKSLTSGKPPARMHHGLPDNKQSLLSSASAGSHLPPGSNVKKVNVKPVKLESRTDSKLEVKLSRSQGNSGGEYAKDEEEHNLVMTEEDQAAFAAAEAARAAALAAAEAYASSEARCNTSLQLPKILSFHKFARREQYAQMDDSDVRRKSSGGAVGRQDCVSEIDSRNCRVRDWSVDFSAACANLDNSKMSIDNLSQRSHSNEIACQLNFREQSAESAAIDSTIFTKAWVDAAGSDGIKDYNAIDRWQSQAAAAESDFFHRTMQIRDEEDSNMNPKLPPWGHGQLANESSVSQVTVNKELVEIQHSGAERIKHAVVDYVASLLMPLYKAKKIDKEGYKSIMKKTATKVMEQTTDAEKAMAVYEFLDFKRKNKIRAFVDRLIERHMKTKPVVKP